MFVEGSTWNRLFSPTLEDAIIGSSKDGTIPKSLAAKLTQEEIEALTMWSYKQHGIMPNQYHYSYEQGDTIIYPEHIRDLVVIDKMISNKLEKEHRQEEAKQKHNKQKNPLLSPTATTTKQKGGSGFYGHTFKYK